MPDDFDETGRYRPKSPPPADLAGTRQGMTVAAAAETAALAMLADEKARRVYYQDIVYSVCNLLDKANLCPVICGNVAEPSTGVQDGVSALFEKARSVEANAVLVGQLQANIAEWRTKCEQLQAELQGVRL